MATETVSAEDEADVVEVTDHGALAGQGRLGAEGAPLLKSPVRAGEEPEQAKENENALAYLGARVTRVNVLLHCHDAKTFDSCQKHCKDHSNQEPCLEPPANVRVFHAFDLESRDLERLLAGHPAHELSKAPQIRIVRVQAHVAGDHGHIEQQTFDTRVLDSLQALDVRTHFF